MIEKLKRIHIEYLLLGFFIMQPFLDIYRCFFMDTISIGPIAIEELLNMLCISIFAIFALMKLSKAKAWKQILLYGAYFVICGAYIIFHYMNIMNFNTDVYTLTSFDFISESYYIIRAYLMPILLIICIYQLHISDKNFMKIVKIVVFIMAGTIVISNILNLSFIAYSVENKVIAGNIFSWSSLTLSSDFDAYTSKGLFYSANQISALLFSLSPLIAKEVIKKSSFMNVMILCLQVIAMVMIGTKTASIGVFLILFAMVILVLFLHFTKLERMEHMYSIPIILGILVGGILLYFISPSYLKENQDNKNGEEIRETVEFTYQQQSAEELTSFIHENYYYFYINKNFLNSYPVAEDPEFWIDVLTRNRYDNISNRTFKIDIMNRIIERNNHNGDQLLGIGYTSNIPYTERDYVYQYGIFGGLGCILLIGPYVISLLYCGIKILRQPKRLFNIQNCSIGMAMCCYLVIAYFAGHVFGMIINMMFMSLYISKLLSNVNQEVT